MEIKSTLSNLYVSRVPIDVISTVDNEYDMVGFYDDNSVIVGIMNNKDLTFTSLYKKKDENVTLISVGRHIMYRKGEDKVIIIKEDDEEIVNNADGLLDVCGGLIARKDGFLYTTIDDNIYYIRRPLSKNRITYTQPFPLFYLLHFQKGNLYMADVFIKVNETVVEIGTYRLLPISVGCAFVLSQKLKRDGSVEYDKAKIAFLKEEFNGEGKFIKHTKINDNILVIKNSDILELTPDENEDDISITLPFCDLIVSNVVYYYKTNTYTRRYNIEKVIDLSCVNDKVEMLLNNNKRLIVTSDKVELTPYENVNYEISKAILN